MEKAGRDPGAVGDMFETMLKRLRYSGDRPPEFLLTHPVTENESQMQELARWATQCVTTLTIRIII